MEFVKDLDIESLKNKIDSDFLQILSHEIRTPLTVLAGELDLLQDSTENKPEFQIMREACAKLLSVSNRMQDLYTLHKHQNVTENTEEVRIDLRLLIVSMLDSLSMLPNSTTNIDIPTEIPEHYLGNLANVYGLLSNLTSLAFGWSSPHNVDVSISLKQITKTHCTLFVQITANNVETIKLRKISLTGQAFFGVGEPESNLVSYVICRQLANNLRSHLDFSLNEKKLSIMMELTLKLNPNHVVKKRRDKSNFKVLIVDDNKLIVRIISHMVKNLNYNYHVASNGQGALEMMKKEAYDLVIMDCNMDVMDGFEATRHIRKRYGQFSVIIAMTADASGESKYSALSVGMDDYFVKPLSQATLKFMIEKWFLFDVD